MVKQQVNVRISDITRDKLNFLSECYGTQAEAIALAVDLLYRETRYGYGGDSMPNPEMVAQEQRTSDDTAYTDLGGEKIRVLIVDDEPAVQENLRKLLYFESDIEVVGVATSGEKGIELAQQLQPHIVLMDRLMPGMGGIAASQAITKTVHYTRIIMTAVHGAESLRRAVLAGARDCLSRPFGGEELTHSIRRVYALAPYAQTSCDSLSSDSAASTDNTSQIVSKVENLPELEELAHLRAAIKLILDFVSKHPELVEDARP